jgi:hypothetical protein
LDPENAKYAKYAKYAMYAQDPEVGKYAEDA